MPEATGPLPDPAAAGPRPAPAAGDRLAAPAAAGLDTRRPFTRADALAAGLPPRSLSDGAVRRLFRGVYVDADVPDSPLLRAEAALLLHPASASVSHTTAARILGLPVPTDPHEHVTVREPGDRSQRSGIRCHVGRPTELLRVGGVAVSGPHQLFVELASMLSLVDLVVLGDAIVGRWGVSCASLVAACEASPYRHAATALRSARLVRAEVDSPMETRLRLLIVLAGLPEPVVNHTIRDERGWVRRRLDLSYPAVRLAVEYDGRQHVEVVDNWRSDLDRREELDEAGWRLLVVTSDGIYKNPGRTVERVHRALRQAGWPGLPSRPSDAWRPHFPGRP